MRISPTASITRLGSFSHLVCLFLLFNFLTPPPGALALFEDQVGKFDWRGLNVGIPKAAKFWETSKDAAIITRNDNVLAALDADSGKQS